jgi:hypothetical protein
MGFTRQPLTDNNRANMACPRHYQGKIRKNATTLEMADDPDKSTRRLCLIQI